VSSILDAALAATEKAETSKPISRAQVEVFYQKTMGVVTKYLEIV